MKRTVKLFLYLTSNLLEIYLTIIKMKTTENSFSAAYRNTSADLPATDTADI